MYRETITGEQVRSLEPYFDDPRLGMTAPGRLLVRMIGGVGYAAIVAATLTALISDVSWLRFLGMFLSLVVLDRIVHAGKGDIPLSELPEKGRVNLLHHTTPAALRIIERASERSKIKKTDFYIEVARELVRLRQIREGLVRLDVRPEEFEGKIKEFLKKEKADDTEETNKLIFRMMQRSFAGALGHQDKYIDPSDLFSALADAPGYTERLFSTFDIEAGDLERALLFTLEHRSSWLRRIPRSLGGFVFESDRQPRHRVMNRAWTARPTPTLDRYGADFTDAARSSKIGFLIGHEEEYNRLIEALSRPSKPNALLIGDAGIGKETIISHFAFALVKDKVPKALFDRRLVALDVARLIAGAGPEELQARLAVIVDEIVAAGNIILYIPDLHNLAKTSGAAYLSAADALMPIILSDLFPIIGTTYPREFKEYIESRSDFRGAFETIQVQEISESEAQTVLVYDSLILERKTGKVITLGAIKGSVRLAKKYFRSKFLPSSAEDLLKSALAYAEQHDEKTITPATIIKVAEEKVNIPIHEADGKEAERLLNMESLIHERLIDQEEAVKAVSDSLREYRSGLSRPGGPIASFLFVGPTGVGKTELAKTLATIEFGSKESMARFDMTEYQDKQSFYRFIGAPDGSTRGALTDAVKEKPYCIVLLDEFEKAYPDILDLFLQVLDDGRLTNNLGETVDFTHTVIIATSNAHSDIINSALREGQQMSEIAEYLRRKLTDVFKPELLNRFSRVVVFKSLSMADMKKVAALQLREVAETASGRGITLTFDEEVISELAKLGYDPAFGARPLRRVIDEKIRSALASSILEKKSPRGTAFRVSIKDGAFVFSLV
ncbi:MAG: ATP-dependent Clp protease ATP-binding subunit [Patescibacteria group bacterium]